MRTNTLLIAAAAALAAGITASNAQTVYSANIVGYVNQVLPANPNFSLVEEPVNGATNTVDGLMSSAIQPGDTVFIWTGTGFNSEIYDPGFNDANTVWIDGNSLADVPAPTIKPGQAFFYENQQSGPETNTWVGTCILSNSIALPANPNFSLVGSSVPIAGDIDSTNFSLPVQSGDTVFTWTGTGFNSEIYDPGFNDANTVWIDGNTLNDVPDPTLIVGEGFFYENQQSGTETWQQNDSYINP